MKTLATKAERWTRDHVNLVRPHRGHTPNDVYRGRYVAVVPHATRRTTQERMSPTWLFDGPKKRIGRKPHSKRRSSYTDD